ncbi:MAG: site-specific integrase [Acholeplasmatales bacterium]|nr:site-specific integrase [Acholeplasmatales bacterium]
MNNLDATELIKIILEKTHKRSLSIKDAIKIFLESRMQNIETTKYYESKLRVVNNCLISLKIYDTSQVTNDALFHIASMLIKKVKPQTVNKYIQSLLTMLRYLADERDLITIPNLKWKKLKENNIERKALLKKEIIHLYNVIQNKSLRIQLVFRLMFETGIRRTELTKIKISNINMNQNSIFLENFDTKAKRSRYLFFTDDLKDLITRYMKQYKSKFFLLEENGLAISPSSVSSIIERLKKDSNLLCLSPHILRRSFATIMLENGANIVCVKTLLGHSSLSQTNKYLITNYNQLKSDFFNFCPTKNIFK